MIKYTKANSVNLLELENIKLEGSIGEKFDHIIYERMNSQKARKHIFREAEEAFLNKLDDENPPLGLWQGEFWGKLIISACRGARYANDEELKSFISDSVNNVLKMQEDDGYIGSYKNRKQIFKSPLSHAYDVLGYDWDCDWTWNIWCRKYTLWGLLEAYELLKDESILTACIKFTNQLIDMLSELNAKICETGTFTGLPSGSILKPILILYKHTENKKYLEFALDIAEQWEDDETCCCKIIKNSLSNKPIHLWNDDTKDIIPCSDGFPKKSDGKGEETRYETSHKAYEMMSCFDGVLELYRVTGNEKYLKATENFFKLLIKYEYNSLFSVGFNDLFINAAVYQNSMTEMCDVVHFIRIAGELYKITGNSEYIDYVELAFYNPLLSGITRDGSWAARGVRAIESNMYENGQVGLLYSHCCTNNMARGMANAAELTAGSSKDSLYINLYTKSHFVVNFEDGDADVDISGDYLGALNTDIVIKGDFATSKKLLIRIPSWSKNTELIVNGALYQPVAGEYFMMEIQPGNTDVNIKFDGTPRVLEGNYNYKFFPTTPYMMLRYFNEEEIFADKLHRDILLEENKARLLVGPILLALSQDAGVSKDTIKNWETICGKKCTVSVEAVKTEGFNAFYNVTFAEQNGKTYTVPMCDFASTSDTMEFKDYRYTIFI